MTNIQRKLYIVVMIVLNSLSFIVTAIKEKVIYPNIIEDFEGINTVLSKLWKYSEIGIIVVIVFVAMFYWIKRKEVSIFIEVKVSLGLFLSIFLVEIILGKIFHLPIGNIVQPLLWMLYIPMMLLILFIMKKLKKL